MFDVNAAERFANLALACVHKEYPNKLSHSLNSDADVAPPRKLTPAFYGCYDWHSSVHGHWLLVRLIRTFPDAKFVPAAREALRQSLTAENIAQEAAYLRAEGRASFERPYGLAWLLQLAAEVREWDDPQAREMAANLRPAELAAVVSALVDADNGVVGITTQLYGAGGFGKTVLARMACAASSSVASRCSGIDRINFCCVAGSPNFKF